ncbi:MAG: hypothetical protein ACYS47_21090 [Planctomycetota bacterium]|jgi:hypothetical protein
MMLRRETRRAVIAAGLLWIGLAGPGCRAIIRALLPGEPPVPPSHWSSVILPKTDADSRDAFNDRTPEEWEAYYGEKDREARELSARLEAYVRGWLQGKNPAKLPPGLLPPTIDNDKTKIWTLCRPEDVKPQEQWGVRPAGEIPADFSKLYFLSPDNHCTYGKLFFLAPFGAELVIEGEFPHCRFFDLQITPPFDPRMPCPLVLGAPEVPIVDVDIDPRPGHVNPFRAGADRTAKKRSYRVTFGLAAGNAVALNPKAMVPPAYRAPGNRRVGGPFSYTGSLGLGTILAGVVWLRYYAPDRGTEPLAGVALPKAHLKLPTGETFWIRCDFSLARARQNKAVAGFETEPEDPPASMGAEHGWWKMFSIWLVTAEGIGYVASRSWLLTSAFVKRLIREAGELRVLGHVLQLHQLPGSAHPPGGGQGHRAHGQAAQDAEDPERGGEGGD